MKLTSMLAIYALFWVMAAIFMLPFGIRTHDEAGVPKVPGQAQSAPVHFEPRKIARRASLLGLVFFGLYYANYMNGWVTVDDLDITRWFPSLIAR